MQQSETLQYSILKKAPSYNSKKPAELFGMRIGTYGGKGSFGFKWIKRDFFCLSFQTASERLKSGYVLMAILTGSLSRDCSTARN